jgi:hypothetical protein
MSSLLCLAGEGVSATVFAAALHFGWTPADGIAREESWHVVQRHFQFLAARVRKDDEWQHYWPARPPQARLVFDRRGLREDYVICGEMWCIPLERLIPRARAPVVEIAPC